MAYNNTFFNILTPSTPPHPHLISHHSTPPPHWKSAYYFILHQDKIFFVITLIIYFQYNLIFCTNEWMLYLFEVLLLFWFVVMSLLSSWDDMDVRVELLAEDVWAAEDDKTGFLSVGVDIFYRLYLKERSISLPMVPMSTIKPK